MSAASYTASSTLSRELKVYTASFVSAGEYEICSTSRTDLPSERRSVLICRESGVFWMTSSYRTPRDIEFFTRIFDCSVIFGIAFQTEAATALPTADSKDVVLMTCGLWKATEPSSCDVDVY